MPPRWSPQRLSRWNHAFASLAVGHGPPVVVGSGGLAASFFLRSCTVSRSARGPGLPATAVELSCRYLRGNNPAPRKNPSARGGGPDRKGRATCLPPRSSGSGHRKQARTPPCQLEVRGEMEYATHWLCDL